MNGRRCEYCDDPLPSDARSDQRFCDRTCKGSARRQRRRREKIRAALSNLPGFGAPLSQSSAYEASREADERFRALLARDEASRAPRAQEAEWAAFERRNPGVAHPGRTVERIARGVRATAEDWEHGTTRFRRPVRTIGETASVSRALNRQTPAPVRDPGPPQWSDDDPDLMEPATMVDGNVFRAGYRHAGGYLR